MQGFPERMPMSPMPESVGSTAHLQPGIPSDAAADAEAMWQLSNHLSSLQLQQGRCISPRRAVQHSRVQVPAPDACRPARRIPTALLSGHAARPLRRRSSDR